MMSLIISLLPYYKGNKTKFTDLPFQLIPYLGGPEQERSKIRNGNLKVRTALYMNRDATLKVISAAVHARTMV